MEIAVLFVVNFYKVDKLNFAQLLVKIGFTKVMKLKKNRGLARKLQLIKDAGGQCSICGYKKNLAALAFHHTDSMKKDFKLDMRSLSNRTLQTILTELDKCVLVCHNCHAELHNPHLNLDKLP